jgi:hypothetical protein
MARSLPLWQQSGTYPARLDRQLMAALWPNGGATGGTATVQNNTMSVSVAAGLAAVTLAAPNGAALCVWDAPEVVTLAAAPGSGTSRIDLIVAQVRDAAIDAGANNDFVIQAVTGVASASPVAPNVPANAKALWSVTVPGAAANLNTAVLADLRTAPLGTSPAVHSRVYRNAAFNWTSTRSLLTFDTRTEDTGLYYSTATGLFTCPIAGLYRVSSFIGLSPAVGGNYDVRLRKAGVSSFLTLGGMAAGGAVTTGVKADSAPIICAAGDTLGLEIWTNQPTSAGIPGQPSTWASFDYAGPPS